jgi:hypothetical protein
VREEFGVLIQQLTARKFSGRWPEKMKLGSMRPERIEREAEGLTAVRAGNRG